MSSAGTDLAPVASGESRRSSEPSVVRFHDIRVLWVADKLGYDDRMHGVGRYFLSVASALERTLVIPVVLRADPGLIRQFEERGLALRALGHGKLDPRTLFALLRVIRSEQVDVVHLHGYGASFFGRLAGRITGTPCVVHQHDSVARAPAYARVLDRLLARQTGRAFAVSESVREFCIEHRSLPADRTRILPNGVAPPAALSRGEREALRLAFELAPGAPLVGCVTRFRAEKGVDRLIAAFARVLGRRPDAHLLVWGDGELRPNLETQIEALGISARVHLLGFDPDAPRYLALLDCFVLPSLSEGLPFALLEAIAAERPVVATAVGGMAELLRDGIDALLVQPDDPGELAAAILRVLGDRSLGQRLARSARATSEPFRLERHARELRDTYVELARGERDES